MTVECPVAACNWSIVDSEPGGSGPTAGDGSSADTPPLPEESLMTGVLKQVGVSGANDGMLLVSPVGVVGSEEEAMGRSS